MNKIVVSKCMQPEILKKEIIYKVPHDGQHNMFVLAG